MTISPSDAPATVPGSRVKLVFSPGSLSRLGEFAKAEGASRVLLVTDPGIRDAGHVERAMRSLYKSGLVVRVFDEVEENPTTAVVGKALRVALEAKPDLIVGLGGGSSIDCAKGANFLYTNGGRMQDYRGTGKATQPMLPMIAIPTTAGTGSEAQSYALITDPQTHQKMACGDTKALPRLAILDAELTATQPARVAAATGVDAIAHAIETAVCKKRNETSIALSAAAWRRLNGSFERTLKDRGEEQARADMLLGAHLAGCAIENSMLGVAHALANPLTGHFGVVHGFAVGMMLPHVVRFNGRDAIAAEGYKQVTGLSAEELASRLEVILNSSRVRRRLSDHDIPEDALPKLAADAAAQWTASFNPRTVATEECLELYRRAF
jgi:alcohol dehydrogenase